MLINDPVTMWQLARDRYEKFAAENERTYRRSLRRRKPRRDGS
jgi:hypothetical protein